MVTLALLFALAAGPSTAEVGPPLSQLTIKQQTFSLPNGLTVVVHEDHAVPIVAVQTWYRVGSRDELKGRTGFAHLFEHFFFNGSQNYPHGFREAMDDLGANNRNGTTSFDRTNFFEDVPTSALERTLYLEADRMGFLAGTINQDMLERERGVVQNEKRQGDNQPYGRVGDRILALTYPAAHPYSWPTIGSMEDLSAAKLDDVKQWYASYYGPSNAVLTLAGDITVERARELTQKYYGAIPPGPPVTRLTAWVPSLESDVRATMQDRVPQTRIYRVWPSPQGLGRTSVALELFAELLAGGDSAPLNRRLVFESKLATKVEASFDRQELASELAFIVDVKAGADASAAERELDAVIALMLEKPATAAQLARAKTRRLASFTRSAERLGGFGGRAAILAESAGSFGDANKYLERLSALKDMSALEIQAAGRAWLGKHHVTFIVEPYPELVQSPERIDRKQLPGLSEPPSVIFPRVQRTMLPNGLKVVLLERHSVPLVNVLLAIDAGASADTMQSPGLSRFALELLLKGTTRRDAFAVAEALDSLGATLEVSSSLDLSMVSLNALRPSLPASLALMAEVARRPSFPPAMVEIQRQQQLAAIKQQLANPSGAAQRVLPPLMFEAGHPYALPGGGLGTRAVVSNLTRDALVDWHQRWFQPGSATLVVAGDVTMKELLPELQKAFGDWAAGSAPTKTLADSKLSNRSAGKVFLLDKPGAPQSFIACAHLAPPSGTASDLALETVMRNFGGISTSRLNRNLRLDKHWSYGASGGLSSARGPRTFGAYTAVQTDKTKESMVEILTEIKGVASARPIAGEEFASIVRYQVSSVGGRFETLQSLVQVATDIVNTNRPPEYFYEYATNLKQLKPEALNVAAADVVKPNELTWVVVGDLAKIEKGVRSLNWGEVTVLPSAE